MVLVVIGNSKFADLIEYAIDNLDVNDLLVLFSRFDIFANELRDFENGLLAIDFLHAFLDEFKRDNFLEVEILKKEVIRLVDIEVLFRHEPAPHEPFESLIVLFRLKFFNILSV